jgi:SAM-dependent methyltransferase
MSHPLELTGGAVPAARGDVIPDYLRLHYWWAYVHPRAIRLFERPWLVNLILWGNYRRLSEAAIDALGAAGRATAATPAAVPATASPATTAPAIAASIRTRSLQVDARSASAVIAPLVIAVTGATKQPPGSWSLLRYVRNDRGGRRADPKRSCSDAAPANAALGGDPPGGDASNGDGYSGRTLQIACVYGDLTERLSRRCAAAGGMLDVVDVLAVQLQNLARKLPADAPARLLARNAEDLALPDASYDRALLFFLLHEQPREVRRRTLSEALRVVRPGGTLVVVDYAQPGAWHPARYLWLPLLRVIEPFARDLWRHDLACFLPEPWSSGAHRERRFHGGLYQLVSITR